MRRLAIILVLLILLSACNRSLRAGVAAQSATSEADITSGGVSRHYRLHVPGSYQPGNPVALVIDFHGLSSNSREEESLSGMSVKADAEGFIAVYPDGLNATWFTGPGSDGQSDRQFVRDLISALEGQYSIDAKRIYATGISNGGGMTDRVACDLADVIAAIAPVEGAYNFWQDCHPSRAVAVLAFHGLDDQVAPYEGGTPQFMEPPIPDWAAAWAERDGCGASPADTQPVDGVSVRTWSGCQGGAQVILYTLANHGHSWPGSSVMPKSITSQAVNATDVMWEFFKAHPIP